MTQTLETTDNDAVVIDSAGVHVGGLPAEPTERLHYAQVWVGHDQAAALLNVVTPHLAGRGPVTLTPAELIGLSLALLSGVGPGDHTWKREGDGWTAEEIEATK